MRARALALTLVRTQKGGGCGYVGHESENATVVVVAHEDAGLPMHSALAAMSCRTTVPTLTAASEPIS